MSNKALISKMKRLHKKANKAYLEYQQIVREMEEISSVPLETDSDNVVIFHEPLQSNKMSITLEDSTHEQYKRQTAGMSLEMFIELLGSPDFTLDDFYNNNTNTR